VPRVCHFWLTLSLLDPFCRYYAVALLNESLFSLVFIAISAAEAVGGLLIQKHRLVVFLSESCHTGQPCPGSSRWLVQFFFEVSSIGKLLRMQAEGCSGEAENPLKR